MPPLPDNLFSKFRKNENSALSVPLHWDYFYFDTVVSHGTQNQRNSCCLQYFLESFSLPSLPSLFHQEDKVIASVDWSVQDTPTPSFSYLYDLRDASYALGITEKINFLADMVETEHFELTRKLSSRVLGG